MKNTNLLYRQANTSDFIGLKALGKASYAEFSKVLSADNWAKMNGFLENDEFLLKLIKESTVFVCKNDQEIVGMIYLVPSGHPTELFKKEWSYIRFLGVNPNFRGLGIAKHLTDLCLEAAKANQEKFIALHTSEFMDAARSIYEKRGFQKIQEIEHFGKRYWIYLLELSGQNN